jgi:hypothetical protein
MPFSTWYSSEGHVRQSQGWVSPPDKVGLNGCQPADPINQHSSLTIQLGPVDRQQRSGGPGPGSTARAIPCQSTMKEIK